jgi:hypothetical protein
MKVFAMLVGVSVFGASAFGFENLRQGGYVGGGVWKTPTGETGRYESKVKVAKTKDGVRFEEQLVIHLPNNQKKTDQYTFTVEPRKNGFFAAMVDRKEVGSGYCFRNQCHIEMSHEQGKSEETYTFSGRRVYRVGSETKGQYSVAWQGSMHRR